MYYCNYNSTWWEGGGGGHSCFQTVLVKPIDMHV